MLNGQCALEEITLVFAAAIDLGGAAGTRVLLRCQELELPQDKEWKRKKAPL